MAELPEVELLDKCELFGAESLVKGGLVDLGALLDSSKLLELGLLLVGEVPDVIEPLDVVKLVAVVEVAPGPSDFCVFVPVSEGLDLPALNTKTASNVDTGDPCMPSVQDMVVVMSPDPYDF